MVSFTHKAEYYLQPNTVGRHCAWADHYLEAVISRLRGGLSANEKEEKLGIMQMANNEIGTSSTRACISFCSDYGGFN